MPLSDLQTAILRTIAGHRTPESYIAGSTPLHRNGPRYSTDIDIFNDREEVVAQAASDDAASLTKAGFAITWLRRQPGIAIAEIGQGNGSMRLEWVRDSDFRFFPAQPDALFGYTLHLADIATNKALASAGRRAPRDALDLLYIHQNHLPLGAVVWAAVGKDLGFSPESLLAEIRRNARYRADDYEALALDRPIDAASIALQLRAALTEAEAFVQAMPAGLEGLLFLQDGVPVQPDPARLGDYVHRAGQRHAVWPSSPEATSAMLERYGKPP